MKSENVCDGSHLMLVRLMQPDPDECRSVLARQLGYLGVGGGMRIPAW